MLVLALLLFLSMLVVALLLLLSMLVVALLLLLSLLVLALLLLLSMLVVALLLLCCYFSTHYFNASRYFTKEGALYYSGINFTLCSTDLARKHKAFCGDKTNDRKLRIYMSKVWCGVHGTPLVLVGSLVTAN